MSYHIYQTEGFIIDSSDLRESSKLLTLFTKELGLIRASAQGIRTLKSKLRYSLQDLSFSSISLVRGKEMWRVTSARKLISLYDKRLPLPVRKMLARTLQFIKRLLPEEGKHTDLFALYSDLSSFCFNERNVFLSAENSTVYDDMILSAEYLIKLRILRILGYGTNEESLELFSISSELNQEVLTRFISVLPKAIREVDKALIESQL